MLHILVALHPLGVLAHLAGDLHAVAQFVQHTAHHHLLILTFGVHAACGYRFRVAVVLRVYRKVDDGLVSERKCVYDEGGPNHRQP